MANDRAGRVGQEGETRGGGVAAWGGEGGRKGGGQYVYISPISPSGLSNPPLPSSLPSSLLP